MSRSVSQSVGQLVSRSLDQSVTVSWSVGQLVSQLVSWSVGQWVSGSVGQLSWWLCLCRTQQNVSLPEPGRYATGILFLDKDVKNAAAVENAFEQLAAQVNLQVGSHHPHLHYVSLSFTYLRWGWVKG